MSSLATARAARKVPVRRFFPKFRRVRKPSSVTCAIESRARQAQNVKREPNIKKQIVFNEIREILNDNKMVTAFHYNDGITSQEWEDLRYTMKQKGITVKIVPNKVTQKSLEGTPYVNMQPLFLSSTGIFYSQESNTTAEMLKILKSYPRIEILGGKFEDRLLSKSGILDFATLPSLDILRGQFSQLLSLSSSRISSLLNNNQGRLASLLTQHLKDRS